ncbi:MAG: pseudouridine synthase [Deltaproteobacteria bacterium]|nr:pseudouridine synthase [Deltaproteobacteria bacterium]
MTSRKIGQDRAGRKACPSSLGPTVVPLDLAGSRLDYVLTRLVPGLSLRQARRLAESGRATVDGWPQGKGEVVRAGQVVALAGKMFSEMDRCKVSLEVAAQEQNFAAVVKPAGMHSVRGRGQNSVEGCLDDHFPGLEAVLLNRLDRDTSGLVLVGFGMETVGQYHEWQDRGEIRKEYLAVVEGQLHAGWTERRALNTAKRSKVRVLEHDDPDSLRWTVIEPMRFDPEDGQTLVRAVILKGRRHQIRAHLSASGHAIVGDVLYGRGEGKRLFLHHARVTMPGFKAENRPEWG